MKTNIVVDTHRPYNKPNNQDTCIILSFFNPINYNSPVYNANIVIDKLLSSNIPFFITELLYSDQKSRLNYVTKTVYAESVIFSKENLWNITEKIVPENYTKLIFLDIDVNFTDPDWFDKASCLLDEYNIIQPMEDCVQYIFDRQNPISEIDMSHSKKSIAYAIKENKPFNSLLNSKFHPGYTVAINRKTFKEINGFFEHNIIGGGDTLFWSSFGCMIDTESSKYRGDIAYKYLKYKINNHKILSSKDVGYLKNNTALHLYHGSIKNRQYRTRHEYINPLNIDNFYYNKYGVLEVKNEPKILQYFSTRNEDGLGL
jgi:hypothetical protein